MKLSKCRIGDYIKDVASGPFGSNLKVECFVPSGFPIIDGANLTGLRVSDNITKFVTDAKARSLSRSIAKRRDVVVTISGTLGQISFIPNDSKYEEYLCSQRQFRVTFDETKINVEYLVNLLRTPYGQRKILAFANYVGVPALAQPIPNFKNIELYLPDLPTQLRIAGILGSLDEKIELNRKKIAELEALAKTIYDYWFVQFDFPDKNGKPYRSSGGKMVWNEHLKREVPEGWEVGRLSNICTISTSQCNPERFTQDTVEHYSIPAFDAGVFPAFDAPQSILSNKFRVVKTSILYSKLNAQFKRIWDPLHITDNPIASSEFVVYVPKNALHRGYLYAVLNGEQFFAFANSISSCSTGSRKRFTPETTYHFSVILPQNAIVEEFSRQYSALLDSMRIARLEIDFLTKQRDFLLPLLMNEQVSVGELK